MIAKGGNRPKKGKGESQKSSSLNFDGFEKLSKAMSKNLRKGVTELEYERTKKVLIVDHKLITRFLMVMTILLMMGEIVFSLWCLYQLQ
jgi:hypothetical protein